MAGRNHEPWLRKDRGWYSEIEGRQVKLADAKATKSEAKKVLARLLADAESPDRPKVVLTWGTMTDLFLDRVNRDLKPTTYTWYQGHLYQQAKAFGKISARSVRDEHLLKWLASKPGWSDSTRRGGITAAKALAKWGVRQNYLATDPFAGIERPKMGVGTGIEPEAAQLIRDHKWDQQFKDLLDGFYFSGCRPGELYTLTDDRVDFTERTWLVMGKTGNRTVHIGDELIAISQRRIDAQGPGLVFRNADGNQWRHNSVRCRFLRLRKSKGFGKEATAKSFRHLFATDALENGVQDTTVAELLGHRDTSMISKVYGHLDKRKKHLRDAMTKVRPVSELLPSSAEPPSSASRDEESIPEPPSPASPERESPDELPSTRQDPLS